MAPPWLSDTKFPGPGPTVHRRGPCLAWLGALAAPSAELGGLAGLLTGAVGAGCFRHWPESLGEPDQVILLQVEDAGREVEAALDELLGVIADRERGGLGQERAGGLAEIRDHLEVGGLELLDAVQDLALDLLCGVGVGAHWCTSVLDRTGCPSRLLSVPSTR